MSSFDNEELKEEEKLSGFDAGEENDESFLVEETGFYPGDQPDMGFVSEDSAGNDSFDDNELDGITELDDDIAEDADTDDIISMFADKDDSNTANKKESDEGSPDAADNRSMDGDDDLLALAAQFTGAADNENDQDDAAIADEDEPIGDAEKDLFDDDDDLGTPEKSGVETDDTGEYEKSGIDSDEAAEGIADSDIDGDEVSMAGQIDVPKEGGSVWDLFEEEEDGSQNLDDESVVEEEDSAVAEEIAEEDDFVGFEEEETEIEDEAPAPEAEEEIMDESVSFSDDTETESDDTENEISDDTEVDNDLMNLIEGELERSKKRKEKKETESDDIEDSPEDETEEEFAPIDDKESEVIDISDIEAEHPSTFDEEKKEDFKMSQPAHKPAVKKGDSKKKRKNRKPLPWMKIGVVSAGSIAILSVIILSYFYLFKPELEKAGIIGGSDSTLVEDIHPVDSHAVGPEHHAEPKHEEKKEEPIVEEQPEHQEVAEDSSHTQPEEEQKEESVIPLEKPKPETVQKTVKHTPKPAQTTKKVQRKTKPRKTTYKDKDLPLPEKPASTGIFTVQVYSSPSKKDALEWLARIKNMNISDSRISSQKIRDQVWYRVRFGKFDTKEKAKAAAKKYGFTQSWIDRIK